MKAVSVLKHSMEAERRLQQASELVSLEPDQNGARQRFAGAGCGACAEKGS
jgi:hypothetical protein